MIGNRFSRKQLLKKLKQKIRKQKLGPEFKNPKTETQNQNMSTKS